LIMQKDDNHEISHSITGQMRMLLLRLLKEPRNHNPFARTIC
jgi:hypothetical protein